MPVCETSKEHGMHTSHSGRRASWLSVHSVQAQLLTITVSILALLHDMVFWQCCGTVYLQAGMIDVLSLNDCSLPKHCPLSVPRSAAALPAAATTHARMRTYSALVQETVCRPAALPAAARTR